MELTRKQFNVLAAVATFDKSTSINLIKEEIDFSKKEIEEVIEELTGLGYIDGFQITQKGLKELEHYRAKRAIFIAAGMGVRLAPITLNTPKPLVRVHGVRIIDRLIDACLKVGIEEIYIVRGYLGELFDQLLSKYPMIKFIENQQYNEANNIYSFFLAKDLLCNAYVFEADLLISNPRIIKKYHYTSNFLGIKKYYSEDWCFRVNNGIIIEEKIGGKGDDNWQVVGVSYWNEADGLKLSRDIPDVLQSPDGKKHYWEQVPFAFRKEHYEVEIRECFDEDIVEIDTFEELKAIDKSYSK